MIVLAVISTAKRGIEDIERRTNDPIPEGMVWMTEIGHDGSDRSYAQKQKAEAGLKREIKRPTILYRIRTITSPSSHSLDLLTWSP